MKRKKEPIVKQKRCTKYDREQEYKIIELCKILKEWNEFKISKWDAFDKIFKLYDKELKLYIKISNTSMEVIDKDSIFQEIKKKYKTLNTIT